MSTYGLSTEQIADVLERDGRTILEWQKALGQKCQSFHLAKVYLDRINLDVHPNGRNLVILAEEETSVMAVHHIGSSNARFG